MTINFNEYLQIRKERLEQSLERYLAKENLLANTNDKLYQAMHYSVFSGGKRLRPILVYASGETFGSNLDDLDAAACAIEFIHTFSLIHDDLPAMDDDDYRRGKLACHKAFGEAIAILAGDALSCLAAEILPNSDMVKELMCAAGARGMIMGQVLDMLPTPINEMNNVNWLENMYLLKTGALFRASIKLGALASVNCNSDDFIILDEFARALGLAFQIKDDIADLATDNKDENEDEVENKITYPFLAGLEQSQARIQELYQQAIFALDKLKKHDTFLLRSLVDLIFE